MSRRFLLEQIDDVAVVQCYADGFEALPLEQKLLAWHLYQAALAGRDIYYDQRCRDGLDMRAVLEQVLLHTPSGAGGAFRVFAEIRRYTKLFWINSGPYNGLTSRKFVLRCTPAEFGEAVRHAHTHGARFPCRHGETLESLLSRLHRPFFDADFEPMLTSKTPEPGRDILTASANNLYAGVSLADLDGFRERYALNSRLIKSPTGVTEQVYRVGGRYDAQIVAIVDHLRSAAGVSPPLTRRALEALIRFYESGEREDRVAYDIAWVRRSRCSGRYHQRFRRSLPRPAGRQRRLGGRRVHGELGTDRSLCAGLRRRPRGLKRACRGNPSGDGRRSLA